MGRQVNQKGLWAAGPRKDQAGRPSHQAQAHFLQPTNPKSPIQAELIHPDPDPDHQLQVHLVLPQTIKLPFAEKTYSVFSPVVFLEWVWVKIKPPENHRLSLFPTRVPFWGCRSFDPQPSVLSFPLLLFFFSESLFRWFSYM